MKLLQDKDASQTGRVNREFRDLNVEELVRGYIRSEKEENYVCVFCGKTFEEGVIFPSGPRLLTAEKAVGEHVAREHGSVFSCLLSMDKQINGLTDIQKKILWCFYEGKETEEICEIMGISAATVRAHRHNLQKMRREAKILLALMELTEEEGRIPLPGSTPGPSGLKEASQVKQTRLERPVQTEIPAQSGAGGIPGGFAGNTLHPFFTQRKFD